MNPCKIVIIKPFKDFGKIRQRLCFVNSFYITIPPRRLFRDEIRFNQTLKNEFLNWGNFHPDPKVLNQKLTNWLVEYNSIRPHQSLNYLTPLEFAEKTMHLSTMWSSSTPGVRKNLKVDC